MYQQQKHTSRQAASALQLTLCAIFVAASCTVALRVSLSQFQSSAIQSISELWQFPFAKAPVVTIKRSIGSSRASLLLVRHQSIHDQRIDVFINTSPTPARRVGGFDPEH
jgi:hypothetical protein